MGIHRAPRRTITSRSEATTMRCDDPTGVPRQPIDRIAERQKPLPAQQLVQFAQVIGIHALSMRRADHLRWFAAQAPFTTTTRSGNATTAQRRAGMGASSPPSSMTTALGRASTAVAASGSSGR